MNDLVSRLRSQAQPCGDDSNRWDALLEMVGEAHMVLLGEASHGTHEFYEARAEITKRLITEKGFTVIALEADWPDTWRVNRYVNASSDDADAERALRGFQRFPTWMWRNQVVLSFVEWLRDYNRELGRGRSRAGLYGLDLYSLNASIHAVLSYLDKVNPAAALRARARYACFDHFDNDPQTYGYATGTGSAEGCEDEVVNQLEELRRLAPRGAHQNSMVPEEHFFAEQNARLIRNAEEYYRATFRGRPSSWNLRDSHMMETLVALLDYLQKQQLGQKTVIWAHNSHLGDARATEMLQRKEINLGQLIRERIGSDALLVGFSTYAGTVTAASDWDSPHETKAVRPALANSYEDLFHSLSMPSFLLNLRDDQLLRELLRPRRLQRAIGVIYRPESERYSHYLGSVLPEQFDALIHLDQTRAVDPLDPVEPANIHELPETFPSAV